MIASFLTRNDAARNSGRFTSTPTESTPTYDQNQLPYTKDLTGSKSDVSDAAWLAQLGAHGLVHGSFVPPAPIRQLRDLTRARTAMTRERGREIQRLEKLLEDAGIKLSSVASDITCVSGRLMLQA